MKSRILAFCLSGLALPAGCTTTAAKLENNAATDVISSAKAPRDLANCIADHMTGASVRDEGGGRFGVVRENGYGAIGRWDVYPSAGGSRAEWRRASSLTTGLGAGRACA